MYIARIPNRNSPPTYLLRESYRENGKVKNRTLANLSALPLEQIELLSRVLQGESLVPAGDAFRVIRSLPHGHVHAVLAMLRRLELESLIAIGLKGPKAAIGAFNNAQNPLIKRCPQWCPWCPIWCPQIRRVLSQFVPNCTETARKRGRRIELNRRPQRFGPSRLANATDCLYRGCIQ
jgi:hypothetical protein